MLTSPPSLAPITLPASKQVVTSFFFKAYRFAWFLNLIPRSIFQLIFFLVVVQKYIAFPLYFSWIFCYSVSSTLTVSLPKSLISPWNLTSTLTSLLTQIQGPVVSLSDTWDFGEHTGLSPNSKPLLLMWPHLKSFLFFIYLSPTHP